MYVQNYVQMTMFRSPFGYPLHATRCLRNRFRGQKKQSSNVKSETYWCPW